MQAPERIEPHGLADYLEVMSKSVFQSGMSWKVVASKWPGTHQAFRGFDPQAIADFTEGDLDELTRDTRIIRNGQKILAIRDNAAFLVDLARETGTAAAFFADWPNADFVGLLELMKKRGSRLGGFTGQMFLRTMGKDSFILNEDVTEALIAAGVIRRKPTSKGDLAAVQEAFNQWSEQSGRPLAHISRTLACSVGV